MNTHDQDTQTPPLDLEAETSSNDAPSVAEEIGEILSEEAPELQAMKAENAKLKDQLLRTMAEMENFKKRSERELQDMAKYARTEFARDLLSVSDNLRRALDSIAPEETESNAMLKNLLSGVELTEKELLKAFEKHGILKLDPLGEKFDHNEHQAMFEGDQEGTEAGIVIQVLQPGYKLHDRLLRPAMVGVSK